MDDIDYKAFVQSVRDNQLLLGVDRVFARRLYTDVPASTIEEATGEAPYIEKLIVFAAFIGGPLALVCSAVLACIAFYWWAFLVLPAVFFWWFTNASISVRGNSSIGFLTLGLIAAVSVHFTSLLPTPWMSAFLSVFVFSLWCNRLLYITSTILLRAFILRNPRALESFSEGITICEVG